VGAKWQPIARSEDRRENERKTFDRFVHDHIVQMFVRFLPRATRGAEVLGSAFFFPLPLLCPSSTHPFFSSGTDRDILIWEPVMGRNISKLRGHFSPVTSLLYHEEADLLCSLDTQSQVKWWDLSRETAVHTFSALADPYLTMRMPIVSMMFAQPHTGSLANHDCFILCCKRLRIWRLSTKAAAPDSRDSHSALDVSLEDAVESQIGLSRSSTSAAAPGAPAILRDEESSEEHKERPGRLQQQKIVAVLVSMANKVLIAADTSGLVVVWDLRSFSQVSWFQADAPSRIATKHSVASDDGEIKASAQEASARAPVDVDVEHTRTRPFEIVRSSKKAHEARARPWASAPRSIFFMKGTRSGAEEGGQTDETLLVTAAALDLLQVRLVLGWSNGMCQVYNFISGSLLQELVSDSNAEIVAISIAERSAGKMAAGSREAAAFIVGADEAGALWLWPNRAPHHVKRVKYVRRLADRDGALADGAAITACKTMTGMIASGASNGRVTLWSLTAGKAVAKVDEIAPFRTRTGSGTRCQMPCSSGSLLS